MLSKGLCKNKRKFKSVKRTVDKWCRQRSDKLNPHRVARTGDENGTTDMRCINIDSFAKELVSDR